MRRRHWCKLPPSQVRLPANTPISGSKNLVRSHRNLSEKAGFQTSGHVRKTSLYSICSFVTVPVLCKDILRAQCPHAGVTLSPCTPHCALGPYAGDKQTPSVGHPHSFPTVCIYPWGHTSCFARQLLTNLPVGPTRRDILWQNHVFSIFLFSCRNLKEVLILNKHLRN